MTYAPSPARAIRRVGAPMLSSGALFRWQARRLSLNALTGQVGTLVRASTATAVDGLGTTWTAPHSLPRYESRDWYGTGTRDALGVRLTTDDVTWPISFVPGNGTLYVEAAEVATVSASGGLVYLGNDAGTGAFVSVAGNGTQYVATLDVGSTAESVTGAVAPSADQVFRLAVQLQLSDDASQIRHRMLIDVLRTEGEDVTAWSTWQTTPTAWGTSSKMRLNRVGSAGTQGSTWVRDFAYFSGIRTLDECAWL